MHQLNFPDSLSFKPKTIVRHLFTPEEDAYLVDLVMHNPTLPWSDIASFLPGRSGRQCRERWSDYLRPNIRVEPWTDEEDDLLIRQVENFGHQWTIIAQAFARRSGNDVKNRWYSHLKYSVFVRPDGKLELARASDGSRISGRPTRKRKQKMPGKNAFAAIEMKRLDEARIITNNSEKLRFPQLCSAELQQLVIVEPDSSGTLTRHRFLEKESKLQ
jgi:hypothetical protein